MHQIRAVSLYSYLDVATFVGLDGLRLLRETGIAPSALDDPESRLPAAAAVRLLELSAERSGCDSFGIRMAQCRSYASLGGISVLLERLPTVGDVLATLSRLRRNLSDVLFVDCQIEGEIVLATFDLVSPFSQTQAADLTVGLGLLALSGATGGAWTPEEVHFTHRRSSDVEAFEQFFRVPIVYNSSFNGFSFPEEQLRSPLPMADSAMAANVRRLLRSDELPKLQAAVSDHTRHTITLLLPQTKATLSEVAKNLGQSPRALQRQLSAEGHSFARLLTEVRREMAQRYLRGSRQSLTDVAHGLGYADLSSFTRWFAGEFTMAPSEWRKALQKSAAQPPPMWKV